MIVSKLTSVLFFVIGVNCQCRPSVTTVIGTTKPAQICSGQLIFEDNFDFVDTSKWNFENTLAGGGNWEFQWYPGYDSRNAFTSNGALHIAPTTTSSVYSEIFLTKARVQIPAKQCTWSVNNGCDRQGKNDGIINPIRSTRIDTRKSFSFKYGVMEIRAKLPAGDWLWPALWMFPKNSVYGGWPRSGEIDLMESRGNRELFNGNTNIGVEQISSTLHFGPDPGQNGFMTAHYEKNRSPGYNVDFRLYKLEWTQTQLKFFVDNQLYGTVDAGDGFWARANLGGSGQANPWANSTKMAPFDQEFFIIINLAVGGTNGYFPDNAQSRPNKKPWSNGSWRAATDFWLNRNLWLPGWNLGNDDSHLQVDYVRVWAL